jgi:hypothetical protein
LRPYSVHMCRRPLSCAIKLTSGHVMSSSVFTFVCVWGGGGPFSDQALCSPESKEVQLLLFEWVGTLWAVVCLVKTAPYLTHVNYVLSISLCTLETHGNERYNFEAQLLYQPRYALPSVANLREEISLIRMYEFPIALWVPELC